MTSDHDLDDLYPDLPVLSTVAEAAALLRINERVAMRLCREGHLGAIKVGRYWRVPRHELRRFLNPPPEDPAPHPAGSFERLVEDVVAIRSQIGEIPAEPTTDIFDRPLNRKRRRT